MNARWRRCRISARVGRQPRPSAAQADLRSAIPGRGPGPMCVTPDCVIPDLAAARRRGRLAPTLPGPGPGPPAAGTTASTGTAGPAARGGAWPGNGPGVRHDLKAGPPRPSDPGPGPVGVVPAGPAGPPRLRRGRRPGLLLPGGRGTVPAAGGA